MIDKNTPAFPVPEYEGHNGERAFRSPVQEGMTYRQWLIGMALCGAMTRNYRENWETLDIDCIDMADAIIERLNKEDKP